MDNLQQIGDPVTDGRQALQDGLQSLSAAMGVDLSCETMSNDDLVRGFDEVCTMMNLLCKSKDDYEASAMAIAYGLGGLVNRLGAIVGQENPKAGFLSKDEATSLRLFFAWLFGRDGVLLGPNEESVHKVTEDSFPDLYAWTRACQSIDDAVREAEKLKSGLDCEPDSLDRKLVN
jgi:hypothetical protein